MFMKFILGEIDRDGMIVEMESHKVDYQIGAASYRDAEALNRQVEVLNSALKLPDPSPSTEPIDEESRAYKLGLKVRRLISGSKRH